MSNKTAEIERLKRGLDELQYENENLRRLLNAKQDEISGLYQQLDDRGSESEDLRNKIGELEELLRDMEEKNKKLNELLNANIYAKAERYKEKVINKLQERSSHTPHKLPTAVVDDPTRGKVQPSPIRLQKILTEEKTQQNRDRERLQRLAENMHRQPDRLS